MQGQVIARLLLVAAAVVVSKVEKKKKNKKIPRQGRGRVCQGVGEGTRDVLSSQPGTGPESSDTKFEVVGRGRLLL